MRTLPKPAAVPADVFTTCISRIADAALRGRLTAVTPLITAAAAEFDTAAQNSTTHRIRAQAKIGRSVTTKEMSAVYTGRMAKKESPGRAIYDELMAAPSHGRCPLCGQRIAATLDHYLPHTQFPALAVTPINLVPACFDCNKSKHDTAAATPEQQTLHPYFDNVEGERWLVADVIEQNPPALRFYVEAPAAWSALTGARVQHHFEMFKLARLYASHSAEELMNIRQQIATLYGVAGRDEIRNHLLERMVSCEANHLNSWQSATYRALANSDWYIDGGFG
jgi:5-methylcytosine-specific restriction endonuclease McrA